MTAAAVTTEQELQQILDLQHHNMRSTTNAVTEREQGFVTVTHTLEILQQMHHLQPSVIVKDGTAVAGYALVMLKPASALVPELFSLYAFLDKIIYKGKPLAAHRFYVMGQICVAHAYRGKGVFDMLYNKHRELFQQKYDVVITEIATRNTRSLRAHERVGFSIIAIHRDALDEWAVVAWNWQLPAQERL